MAGEPAFQRLLVVAVAYEPAGEKREAPHGDQRGQSPGDRDRAFGQGNENDDADNNCKVLCQEHTDGEPAVSAQRADAFLQLPDDHKSRTCCQRSPEVKRRETIESQQQREPEAAGRHRGELDHRRPEHRLQPSRESARVEFDPGGIHQKRQAQGQEILKSTGFHLETEMG